LADVGLRQGTLGHRSAMPFNCFNATQLDAVGKKSDAVWTVRYAQAPRGFQIHIISRPVLRPEFSVSGLWKKTSMTEAMQEMK
jgi:hypothetical protein